MKKKLIILIILILAFGIFVLYQKQANGPELTDDLKTFIDRDIPAEHEARLTADIARLRREIGDRLGSNKSMEDLDRWINIANLQYILGQLSGARETLLEALALNPVNYVAWGNLGDVLAEMGDWRGAAQAYQKAIENSNYSQYVIKYADFLEARRPDEKEEYERILKAAVDSRGQKPEFISRLADFYMKEARFEEAVSHYEVLVGLVPEDRNVQRDLHRARQALDESKVVEQ